MVAINNLVNTSASHLTQGNHRKEPGTGGAIANFIYHWTIICQTLPDNHFTTNHGGYYTRSTNRAISAYRKALTAKGYTEI